MGFILAALIGFAIVAAIGRMQRSSEVSLAERRDRQRAQRVGLAPIPGADGKGPGAGEDAA